LIARRPKSPAHLAPPASGMGCRGDKFETDKNKSILTCFCLLIIFQRNPYVWDAADRSGLCQSSNAGFWHLTLCTLLSSQGSDAPVTSPCSVVPRAFAFVCYPPALAVGNLSNLAPSWPLST